MTREDRALSTDVAFARTLGAPPSASLPSAATPDRASFLERVRAAVRGSPWTSLAGRALILLFGLVVLAWIGRAATAATPRVATAPSAADAGAPITGGASAAPSLPTVVPPPAAPPAPAPVAPPSAATPSSNARATAEDPVYINYASAEELRRLPGVGPKRAESIVALRQRMGRFQRVEDLLRVKGIGRTTIRKWRPLLRLDAPRAGDAGAP